MIHLEMRARVPDRSAAEVFALLSDLARYPDVVEAVRSITVGQEDGRMVSTWEVDFHGGIMRWKEEDVFLPQETTMRFRQLEGDVDHFAGEWKLTDSEGGCVAEFEADFDLGVEGLSDVLNPIADSALRENVRGILTGLVGQAEFDS
jgi:ribosome-associated toxin RatA of RatAB toxin-antitoxin module